MSDADWFEDAGATVTHKPYDELDRHSLVPDFEERLPEWIPDLLLVADAPAPAGSPPWRRPGRPCWPPRSHVR